ncbi:MAG: FtsX-like permease family protein [Acidobacteria bacterium]|nr:MAG: FtsX-like permease family protein [Acidobacteriota bacterium]
MFNWFSQIFALIQFNLRTIWQRKGSSAAALFGIAGVVAVLVGVLSIAQGFSAVMNASGKPDTALILRSGADTEMMSGLSRETTRIIADTEGIARSTEGALASAELFVIINLPKRSTGTDANVPLRGVEPMAFSVRSDVNIIQGRPFEWGRNEVIVGSGAVREFEGLELGGRIPVGKEEWTVVGIFEANGGISESEIWTDASVLQPAFRRGNSFQAVYVKIETPESFQDFKDRLTTDPRLNVKVIRQDDYYADQSTAITGLITGLGTLIAGLMGIGAVFGALNTMYSAVSSRTREIATLRALGFGNGPIVISVMVEALVLALIGGAIGAGLAYVAFDGFRAATMNWQSFSQVAFAFDVTPGLLVRGIFYAAIIGLVGGLFPAIRAARMPVAAALREG